MLLFVLSLFCTLVSNSLSCILHTKGIYLSMDIRPFSENVNIHTYTQLYIFPDCLALFVCCWENTDLKADNVLSDVWKSERERVLFTITDLVLR